MAVTDGYLTSAEAGSYIGRQFADGSGILDDVVTSVSRMIDQHCGRHFYRDGTTEVPVARVFEVENIDYDRLEISSPGIDRPLKKLADFERFMGENAQIRLSLAVGNQRNFVGLLGGVRDGAVVLTTEKGEHLLPFQDIEKARLVPKF